MVVVTVLLLLVPLLVPVLALDLLLALLLATDTFVKTIDIIVVLVIIALVLVLLTMMLIMIDGLALGGVVVAGAVVQQLEILDAVALLVLVAISIMIREIEIGNNRAVTHIKDWYGMVSSGVLDHRVQLQDRQRRVYTRATTARQQRCITQHSSQHYRFVLNVAFLSLFGNQNVINILVYL